MKIFLKMNLINFEIIKRININIPRGEYTINYKNSIFIHYKNSTFKNYKNSIFINYKTNIFINYKNSIFINIIKIICYL